MKQHDGDIGTSVDLSKYRLEKAKSNIKSAKLLMEAYEYCDANNRAYYAIFHAISAIHALDGKTYKKHKDTIANFNKEYVKAEIFPRSIGRRITKAEEIRHASDYDDFYIATGEEAKKQLETAEELLIMIEDYCRKRWENR